MYHNNYNANEKALFEGICATWKSVFGLNVPTATVCRAKWAKTAKQNTHKHTYMQSVAAIIKVNARRHAKLVVKMGK